MNSLQSNITPQLFTTSKTAMELSQHSVTQCQHSLNCTTFTWTGFTAGLLYWTALDCKGYNNKKNGNIYTVKYEP